jgi:hypothetical protein
LEFESSGVREFGSSGVWSLEFGVWEFGMGLANRDFNGATFRFFLK